LQTVLTMETTRRHCRRQTKSSRNRRISHVPR